MLVLKVYLIYTRYRQEDTIPCMYALIYDIAFCSAINVCLIDVTDHPHFLFCDKFMHILYDVTKIILHVDAC